MVFKVLGSFLLVVGLVSDPPGPILESVFLLCVSVDRNLPGYGLNRVLIRFDRVLIRFNVVLIWF